MATSTTQVQPKPLPSAQMKKPSAAQTPNAASKTSSVVAAKQTTPATKSTSIWQSIINAWNDAYASASNKVSPYWQPVKTKIKSTRLGAYLSARSWQTLVLSGIVALISIRWIWKRVRARLKEHFAERDIRSSYQKICMEYIESPNEPNNFKYYRMVLKEADLLKGKKLWYFRGVSKDDIYHLLGNQQFITFLSSALDQCFMVLNTEEVDTNEESITRSVQTVIARLITQDKIHILNEDEYQIAGSITEKEQNKDLKWKITKKQLVAYLKTQIQNKLAAECVSTTEAFVEKLLQRNIKPNDPKSLMEAFSQERAAQAQYVPEQSRYFVRECGRIYEQFSVSFCNYLLAVSGKMLAAMSDIPTIADTKVELVMSREEGEGRLVATESTLQIAAAQKGSFTWPMRRERFKTAALSLAAKGIYPTVRPVINGAMQVVIAAMKKGSELDPRQMYDDIFLEKLNEDKSKGQTVQDKNQRFYVALLYATQYFDFVEDTVKQRLRGPYAPEEPRYVDGNSDMYLYEEGSIAFWPITKEEHQVFVEYSLNQRKQYFIGSLCTKGVQFILSSMKDASQQVDSLVDQYLCRCKNETYSSARNYSYESLTLKGQDGDTISMPWPELRKEISKAYAKHMLELWVQAIIAQENLSGKDWRGRLSGIVKTLPEVPDKLRTVTVKHKNFQLRFTVGEAWIQKIISEQYAKEQAHHEQKEVAERDVMAQFRSEKSRGRSLRNVHTVTEESPKPKEPKAKKSKEKEGGLLSWFRGKDKDNSSSDKPEAKPDGKAPAKSAAITNGH